MSEHPVQFDTSSPNSDNQKYKSQDNFDVSLELIPDEYQRKTNTNILVELIYDTNRDKVAQNFAKRLKTLDYDVNVRHLENPFPYEIEYKEILNSIKDKLDAKDYDGMIVLFSKQYIRINNLKEIWNPFTSLNCLSLKNKPKIFIFQIMDKKEDLTDTKQKKIAPRSFVEDIHDTPSEADISLIVDKIEYTNYKSKFDLLENLDKNIGSYGAQEHLHTLLSISKPSSINRPLHVSTMTKQFYFEVSDCRGLHYRMLETVGNIKRSLEIDSIRKKSNQRGASTSKSVTDSSKKVTLRRNKSLKDVNVASGSRQSTSKSINDRPIWKY